MIPIFIFLLEEGLFQQGELISLEQNKGKHRDVAERNSCTGWVVSKSSQFNHTVML